MATMLDAMLFGKHLEEDETVSVIVHRHWLMAGAALFFPTVSLLLSLAALPVSHMPAAMLAVGLWAAASAVWWMRSFFDYYLDAWIITDQAVIDLEWHGWFHRQSSRILYSDVQGVSYEIKGIAGTLLRYGTITVEKISTGAAVSMGDVPNPRGVEATILRNMETYLHKKNLKDAKRVQEILAGFVAEQMQLKDFDGNKKEESAPASQPPKKKHSFQSSKVGSKRS